MLYPENIEYKLGFDRIREALKAACISPMGRGFVDKIRFSDNFDLVERYVRQTHEMKRVLEQDAGFPSQNYIDTTASLEKARIEGMLLTEEAFFDLKTSLNTVDLCLRFFRNSRPGSFPLLQEFSENISVDKSVTDAIGKVIDDRGKVRDNASPELLQIRKKLISEQAGIRQKLDTILKAAKSSGWVSDDVSLTIRNGRMVIPVAAEFKRKLRGFIHDESATGQTVFIEPTEVFEANNEIRELGYEERREMNRILIQLTDTIRPHLPDLHKACRFLGLMDFLRAKARLAIDMDASFPKLMNDQVTDWKEARHPLLHLSFRKQHKKVVPLEIHLSPAHRILIISGPNAGGKSVALKTVGLIQYMHQCGLLVPLAENSSIGIFRNIFIDIGDEQSLENDLSTYSSHLSNMRQFVARADKKTLFLIDEFGTGTEPGLGGAIAEAILESLTASGAYGVINTHYTNLKLFADKTPGLVNGAMRFDGENLEPLYELETGKPGSSFAFEIASKIGLPRAIIESAKQKLGVQQVNFEKLLKELDIERRVFAEKNREIIINERKLAQQLAEYTALKTTLENDEKKIRNKAKQQAKELVAEANRLIENTIREIREQKAEKTATREIRATLEDFAEETLREEPVEPAGTAAETAYEPEEGVISVGSYVRLKGQEAVGEVISMKGRDAEIRMGSLKSTIKLDRLEKVSGKTFKNITGEKKTKAFSGSIDLNEKMLQFSFNLDIRGKRGEEALIQLDQFMNDALMLGYEELRVIHGKGDGILRNLVRNHLRSYRQVRSLADEHADRGGAGVTLVSLK